MASLREYNIIRELLLIFILDYHVDYFIIYYSQLVTLVLIKKVMSRFIGSFGTLK